MSFRFSSVAALALVAGCSHSVPSRPDAAGGDWLVYRGNPHGTLYSALDQIDRSNVSRLRVAWTFDTGEGGTGTGSSEMESNPLVVDGRLYANTPKGRVVALDGATGRLLWDFRPAGDDAVRTRQRLRGLSYWTDGNTARLFTTFRSQLIALDPATGKPVAGFGRNGRVALSDGIDRDPSSISVANVTPGLVMGDVIILGSTGRTPGDIRAFDVQSGKVAWVFHAIPHPGEPGYASWPRDAWKTLNGANNWAGMSGDPQTGLVFVPLASPGMADADFYGADRPGDNLFGDAIVALDARTGRRVWHFQTVRHDLWDRDLPAPPTLITVQRGGLAIPALAQITKSGYVFILDRRTGKSLYPLQTFAVPASDVPGERAAPTQTLPTLPLPFARQQVTRDRLTTRTPAAHAAALKAFLTMRSEPWAPPSLPGTLMLPGTDGGGEWGGAAFDPETGLLYVNAIEMAKILKLSPRPPAGPDADGEALYRSTCAACHGADRAGSPPDVPSLIGIAAKLPREEIVNTIGGGAGRMPAFWNQLGSRRINLIVDYLSGTKTAAPAGGGADRRPISASSQPAYIFAGYTKFLDSDQYPAITPPWGTLNAIDVNTGRYVWKIPFGEYPELVAKGVRHTGSENYGGGIVTKGGLLLIGATVHDARFHAYDKRTGRLLWETKLPLAGVATPSTYLAAHRQFVVIAAGGGKATEAGSTAQIVAFALPQGR